MRPIVHLNSLPPRHSGDVAIDTEIFQMDRRQLHRPNGTLACITFCPDGKNVYFVTDPLKVHTAIDRVANANWIMHNANFDLRHLRRWCPVIPKRQAENLWDTLIMERLLWSGWFDGFSLAALSRRYFDVYMEKDTRDEFSKTTEMTEDMIQYAAVDAINTYRIKHKQAVLLRGRPDVWPVWEKIDCPALLAVMDFKGIRLDRKAWTALAEKASAKMEEVLGELGFNPNSPQQVKAALAKQRIFVESTGEEELLPYKENKIVQGILSYREASKRAGTYGWNILELLEEDDILFPNHEPTEAVTGRMTSDSPNIQNVPHDREYRVCYIARKKHKLVGGDYEQQEPYLATVQHRDQTMWQAFEEGESVHVYATRAAYKNEKLTKANKKEYDIGKRIHLGTLYGLTPYGMAAHFDLPLIDCKILSDNFFKRFPGIENWISRCRQEAYRDGYVQTLMGRRHTLNLYSKQWPNHAINSRVQGSAADITKMAVAKLHAIYGESIPIVAVVHDEILMDVPNCDGMVRSAERNLRRCMTQAVLDVVSDGPKHDFVETFVGRTWADKK